MRDSLRKTCHPQMYFTALLLVTLLAAFGGAQSQDKKNFTPSQHTTYAGMPQSTLINVNNVSMWANANGVLERRLSDLTAGVTYPQGTSTAVFAGGLLWGGLVKDGAPNALRVGGQTYLSGTVPGAIIAPGIAEDTLDASVRIYRVRRNWATADLTRDASEIYGVSLLDVTQDMIDAVRAQYKKDWLEWPWQKGAPYYERNGIPGYQPPTGDKYDPTEDEPGVADADQVVWFVSNDLERSAVANLYGSPRIGIEEQVTCWAYTGRSDLENAVFQRFKLIYKGLSSTPPNARIDSMFIAKWVDPDIGTYSDDFAGSDPGRNLGYAYNSRPVDIEYDKYGLTPPAIGYALLQGPRAPQPGGSALWNLGDISGYANLPMNVFTYFTQTTRTTDFNLGTYLGTLQWWNIFNGFKGSPVFPPQCLSDPFTGRCTPIELSGDPLTFRGPVDGRQDSTGDRRFAIVSGSFSMALGDTQEVVFAMVGAQGKDNRDAVGVLKNSVDKVQDIYKFHFVTPAPVPVPPLQIVELDKRLILDWESDTTQTNFVETYNSKGYRFEGYNIYQFPSLTAPVSQAAVWPPFDITLPRSKYIDNDLLRNNHALVNGQEYYFAVTSVMYNPNPGIAIPRIESPVVVKAARPHSPNPGTVYPYPLGDIVTNNENVHDTYSANDAVVNTAYYDPTKADDHDYKIRFHRDFATSQKATFDFIDISEFRSGTAVGGSDQPTMTQTIVHTTNGGGTWTPQSSGTPAMLQDVALADIFIGNAVGLQGKIYRTTDGGDHWLSQASGVSVPLYGVALLDTGHGTAVGASGTIVMTSDGGNTWSVVPSPIPQDLHAVAWLDKFKGFIVGSGGKIMHTINGGHNDSTNFGYRYGWINDSTDTQEDLSDVAFPDLNYGIAVGNNGTIERTTDGGFRWRAQQSGTANNLYAVSFLDKFIGVASGANGTILRTTDGGITWISQSSGTSETLYGISFTDPNAGTAVGTNGTIVRTTDGGATWMSQTSGTTATLRSVAMSSDNELIKGTTIDSRPQRLINRGMTVEITSPYFGVKGVVETRSNFQYTRSGVFNVPNPGENYMVVGKGYSNLDTIRGGSSSDLDIELRFNGDSSWALFRAANVPQSKWVRVPYQAWGVGKIGRDSLQWQLYTAITRTGGDSIWRPQVLLDRSYKGKTLKMFYPITIIADSFRQGSGYIGNGYDDGVGYAAPTDSARIARKNLKGFVWGLTQAQQDANAIWEAYIGDVDDDGIPAPLGTTFRFEKYHKVRDRDEKLYTPSAVQKENHAAALQEVEKINVFPNPYYAFNRAEPNKLTKFVRFNHLPYDVTIRVFNLAGVLVKTIRKQDDSQFTDWDLNNELGLPAASGVYIAYMELKDKAGGDLGTKNLKLMIVQQSQGGN